MKVKNCDPEDSVFKRNCTLLKKDTQREPIDVPIPILKDYIIRIFARSYASQHFSSLLCQEHSADAVIVNGTIQISLST